MNNQTTTEVSGDPIESTRKKAERIQTDILNRLRDVKQVNAATCMGVSESTVSRMTHPEELNKFCQLLAALGMHVSPADAMVIPREDLTAYKRFAYMYLKLELEKDGLI